MKTSIIFAVITMMLFIILVLERRTIEAKEAAKSAEERTSHLSQALERRWKTVAQQTELSLDDVAEIIDFSKVFSIIEAHSIEVSIPSINLTEDFAFGPRSVADAKAFAEIFESWTNDEWLLAFEYLYQTTRNPGEEFVLSKLANLLGFASPDEREYHEDEDGVHGGSND